MVILAQQLAQYKISAWKLSGLKAWGSRRAHCKVGAGFKSKGKAQNNQRSEETWFLSVAEEYGPSADLLGGGGMLLWHGCNRASNCRSWNRVAEESNQVSGWPHPGQFRNKGRSGYLRDGVRLGKNGKMPVCARRGH